MGPTSMYAASDSMGFRPDGCDAAWFRACEGSGLLIPSPTLHNPAEPSAHEQDESKEGQGESQEDNASGHEEVVQGQGTLR